MTNTSASRRPILVTGAHRSGTTWVGRMLAANPRTAYISEPLNRSHRPGVLRAHVPYWYTYIHEENEAGYLHAFQELLGFRYHLLDEIRSLRSGRDLLRMGRDLGIFARGRALGQLPLLKDPFAVFSLPWFAGRLGCRVVVTVRHPAGFASSLKRLAWPFDFQDLLAQEGLMRDWLGPYRADMQAIGAEDVIGQAGLLWTMVYRAVHSLRQRIPSILIVRHEDLARDPLGGYRELYEALELPWSEKVRERIATSSSAENPSEVSRRNVHSVRLDSRANVDIWKKRLAPAEIERLRRATEEVTQLFYPDVDWK